MATIAVGDIHGNLAALSDILDQIRNAVAPTDTVVFLGDYIDRGPDTKGCVDAILRFQHAVTAEVVCLWFSAANNLQRIRDADVDDGVFPIHADARALPFAPEFFDAVVSIDSFVYYGTDDLYLNYLARFLKPGGVLGIAGAGVMQEIGWGRAGPSSIVVGAEHVLLALGAVVASALGADRHP